MKSTLIMPLDGQKRVLLCLFLLFLIPAFCLSAQEGSESRGDASPGSVSLGSASERPAEESLLILDSEEQSGEAAEDQDIQSGPLVSSWDFLRMVLILAAVVGVIYLIFWMLKRGFKKQLPQNDLIHLLGSRNLTGNRALHLVELGKQIFLVGAAEGSISLISEIKDQETLDSIVLERSQSETRSSQGFAEFLKSFLKTGKQQGGSQRTTLDFMKQQRRRLEKL